MTEEDENMKERGEDGAAIGGAAGGAGGQAIGSMYGGPLGGMVGQYVGEKIGSYIGDKIEDKINEELENQDEQYGEEQQDEPQKKKGGGCSGGTGPGVGDYSASDGQCHKSPCTPKHKLEIEENDVPENWWDKLPDFDPRVYDAISFEQAAACVKYIFNGLPDIHELEHLMEARKNRKNCPRLKTNVPRTKVIKPKEIKYETTIDTWIKSDRAY